MSKFLEQMKIDFEASGYWQLVGMKFEQLEEGRAQVMLPYRDNLLNVSGTVHGGIYMSLLDTTMGVTARSIGYQNASTLQMTTQFLKTIIDKNLYSEATIISKQANTIFVEGRLLTEAGELAAYSTATFRMSEPVQAE